MSSEMQANGHVVAGPWGGHKGAKWDDGIFIGVRQVVISCGAAAIDSIQIEYDKKGPSVWSDNHGGSGGFKIIKVKLNYPDEFLVSISGYYGSIIEHGPILVRSLTFESNKTRYGPFGVQQGTHFSNPMTGGTVVGFHGRSSQSLNSIGVHLKPLLISNPPNNFSPSQKYTSYEIINEKTQDSNMREKLEDIILSKEKVVGDNNFKNHHQPEITINRTGYYGSALLSETTVVKSHSFPTNRRAYGPFVDEQGIPFTSGSNNEIFAGFPGRKGRLVDDIGAFVNAIEGKPPLTWPSNDSFNTTNRKISQVFPGMVKKPSWFSSGPWGGNGGRRWDDGVFSGVKKIFLFRGEAIYSIQIEYDRNGQSVLFARHGGGSEGSPHTITFQYPLEVLIGFCGYHESLTGDEGANAIKSLTFFTNKGKHGPVGEEKGAFFTSMKSEGKIVGFHGSSGCYLNAIGAHIQVQR